MKMHIVTAVALSLAVTGFAQPVFKAGYSKVDITPALGTPMSGYYHHRAAEGVIDPLRSRCLALSDGETTALVYAIDNLGLNNEMIARVKAEVAAAVKIPEGAIYLAGSHIHTGPCTGWNSAANNIEGDEPLVKAANEVLVAGCVKAAKLAVSDLAPSKIMIGRGEATGISFIRRFKMKDGSVRTNPPRNDPNVVEPLGKPDESLQLVRFVREGAKEIALINFQCHPDVVSGNKFSADWPGIAADTLENAFKGEIHAMLLNGAQGDTNHYRQKWRKGDYLPTGINMARHMARTIVGGALKAWDYCRPVPAGKVQADTREVEIFVNKGKRDEFELAEKWAALVKAKRRNEIPGEGMLNVTRSAWACRVVETRNWPDSKKLPVSVVSVGRALAFGGFCGEPFTVFGVELKNRSKFAMTIPTCTTNGYNGYFPDESAFTVGGYENATSRYQKGSGERLLNGLLSTMDEFWANAKAN